MHGGAIAYVGGPGRRRGQGGAAARSGGGRRRRGRTTGVKHQASAPVEVTNRCLCHGHLAAPVGATNRCLFLLVLLVPVGGTTRCLFASFSTGWCLNPVPKPFPLSAAGQRYQLLLQPVLMRGISTGCNSSWYLWPGPLACFLVV